MPVKAFRGTCIYYCKTVLASRLLFGTEYKVGGLTEDWVKPLSLLWLIHLFRLNDCFISHINDVDS